MAAMAPKAKRARTDDASDYGDNITLNGGEAHHSSLAALWRQEKLTDIAVCAEGVEFKAHRAALAASSGYFFSLFDSGMRDATSPTHSIEGLRSPVLEALLAFIYEGLCQVEMGLLSEMLDASARLVVDPLKAACARVMQAQLGPCNALDVWRLADLYTLPWLQKAAVDAALCGFEELPPQSATVAQVLALVQEDGLVAKNEESVFQWVVRWQEAAQPTEAELLAAMKHVRFAAMDAGFVQTTVRTWSALDSKEGLGIILDATFGPLRALRRSGLGPQLVYVLGGQDRDGEILSTVDVYDPRRCAWKQLSPMPTARHMHGGAVLDGKIYVLGGRDADEATLSTADVYDPQSDQWQPLADLMGVRADFAAAATGGKIYAVGGETSVDMCSVTVEAFDPLLGAWASVASMSVQRCYHAVAVVDGKIYAIGGYGADNQALDSVEMYDPQADEWLEVASMPKARRMHAATAMGGKIYVSGGFYDNDVGGDVTPTRTVIVFDPEVNTWTEVASMGTYRSCHTSAATRGKLLVFGGFTAADASARASAEAYDPISDTWARVSTNLTGTGRDEFAAVAL